MPLEESIEIQVGGTIRSRWAACVAVVRRFAVHFIVVLALWLLLGLYLNQFVFHAELATVPLAVSLACNVLGIDPGQLLIRGTITFTPTRVWKRNILGHTKEHDWEWVRAAEEPAGNLHIVLGRHRSRIVVLGHDSSELVGRLRDLLIAKGKLPGKLT